MKNLTISAKLGKTGEEHSIKMPFPETLDEMVDVWGEEVVYGQAKANIIVGLQGNIRSRVGSEKDPKEGAALQESFADYKPGIRQPGVARVEKLKERISKMSPEQKAALLAELTADDNDEQEPEVPQPVQQTRPAQRTPLRAVPKAVPAKQAQATRRR